MTSSLTLLAEQGQVEKPALVEKPKQKAIPSFMEEIATDRLFDEAQDHLHYLRAPSYEEKQSGALQSKIVELYEEMSGHVYRAADHFGIYDSEVMATMPYRFVLRISRMSPEEILYVLQGSIEDTFMGKNAKGWKTREEFKQQIIHDAARTEARRQGKNIYLSQLTRESNDSRSPEEIASSMKKKIGSAWNPKPVGVERPPGKWEADLRDIVEGSNERVGGIPYGLANIYYRAVSVAVAPKFKPKEIEALGEKAARLYRSDIQMIMGADAAIYPLGGPLKAPADVHTGNDSGDFTVYWVTDGKTMNPYLGDMGKKKTKSLFNEMISFRMNRELIAAIGRSFAGRIDTADMAGLPEDLQQMLLATQNSNTKLTDHTIVYRHMPDSIRGEVVKQLREALSEPRKFLARDRVSPPQVFTQTAKLVGLPRRKRDSMVKALRSLAAADGMSREEAGKIDLEEFEGEGNAYAQD